MSSLNDPLELPCGVRDNVSRVQLALTSVTPTAVNDAVFAAATTSK